MEFGFSLPGRGPLARLDVIQKMAAKAESLRGRSASRRALVGGRCNARMMSVE